MYVESPITCSVASGATLDVTGYFGYGSSTIIKTGAGSMVLAGANTYSGGLIVSGGTLDVTGSSGAASPVTVQSGAILGGTGTVKGTVTLQSGGTLAAGVPLAMGTLTLANMLTLNAGSTSSMRINKTGGVLAGDTISGWTGTLNYTGTLLVTNVTTDASALAAGDSFTLFSSSGATSGNFNNFILPALGPGLAWDWTPASGILSVVAASAPPAFSGVGTFSKGSFSLTFSGASGRIYKVLMTTNLALPAADWTVLSSGTFGAGAVNFTDSSATNAQRFYLISSP
jgi:autotransporter-associated beta strand protein